MPRAADVWLRLQLLLALSGCGSVTASPAAAPPGPDDGLQALLHQAPEARPEPQPQLQRRKLHGRFLHITGTYTYINCHPPCFAPGIPCSLLAARCSPSTPGTNGCR